MRVCCDVSVFNREHGCVFVCCGCWNSIRQMGLFRVLSLLPKKGPICFSIFANNTHQYVHCISIFLKFFPFTCLVFVLSLPFAAIGYSHWWKQNAPEPLSQPENELEKLNGGVLQVSRERRKREPSVQVFYCRDYSVQLDSETESWSRQPGSRWRKERTEMIHLYRGSPRADWVRAVWFSKWHEHLSFKYH